MALDRRELGYVVVRGGAAAGFVASALVLPPGLGAGVACVVCGVVGIAACIGTNAGGPGERAGARAQQRALDRVRAPQGDWPPY